MAKQADKAVVLLSGGLDSATAAVLAREQGFALYALTVHYGQRHLVELEAARRVATALQVVEHRTLHLDLRAWGGSALTADLDVPAARPDAETGSGVPITYVPARNTVLLSLALGYAEVIGASAIFIGVSAVDYSGYPDCRPEFIEAFEGLAALATKAGIEGRTIKIHAPLIHLSKAQAIREGLRLGLDYSLTHTCYDPTPGGIACGRCESCALRRRGFAEAGLTDPAPYASEESP